MYDSTKNMGDSFVFGLAKLYKPPLLEALFTQRSALAVPAVFGSSLQSHKLMAIWQKRMRSIYLKNKKCK